MENIYGVVHYWYPEDDNGGHYDIEWYPTLELAQAAMVDGDVLVKALEWTA